MLKRKKEITVILLLVILYLTNFAWVTLSKFNTDLLIEIQPSNVDNFVFLISILVMVGLVLYLFMKIRDS